MTNETGGAVEKAREMYPGHSTLCYGVQWDAVMRWISRDSTSIEYLTDSSEIGNYNTSKPIETGTNPIYQLKNIYDMAGNVWEWTMEAYNTDFRVRRGGSYNNVGSDYTIAFRNNDFPNSELPFIGFRVTLYV